MYFIRTGFVDVHSSLLRDGQEPPRNDHDEGPPGGTHGARTEELLDTLCEGECFGELALLSVPTAAQLPVCVHVFVWGWGWGDNHFGFDL